MKRQCGVQHGNKPPRAATPTESREIPNTIYEGILFQAPATESELLSDHQFKLMIEKCNTENFVEAQFTALLPGSNKRINAMNPVSWVT